MVEKITLFPGGTILDIPPNQILNSALQINLDSVIIIGVTKDNTKYYASSSGDRKELLWDTQIFKQHLLNNFQKDSNE